MRRISQHKACEKSRSITLTCSTTSVTSLFVAQNKGTTLHIIHQNLIFWDVINVHILLSHTLCNELLLAILTLNELVWTFKVVHEFLSLDSSSQLLLSHHGSANNAKKKCLLNHAMTTSTACNLQIVKSVTHASKCLKWKPSCVSEADTPRPRHTFNKHNTF